MILERLKTRYGKGLGIALLALIPMALTFAGCAVEGGGGEGSDDDSTSEIMGAGYLGSSFCLACHPATYNSWLNSQHNKKINTLSEAHGPGIIADSDYDGNNDFSQGIVIGDPTDPNFNNSGDFLAMNTAGSPPTLGESEGVPTVTIGPITYNVDFTIGGKWKQRYATIIGNDWYILPLQYNPMDNLWSIYHGENWYDFIDGDADNAYDVGEVVTGPFYNLGETPLTNGKTADSWQRRCAGCHATGLVGVTEDPSGEIIADFSERNIACEACHGPARMHVSQGGGLGSILNPALLSDFEAGNVCGRCHTRGDSKYQVAGKTLAWPWPADGSPYQITDPMEDHFDATTASSKWWNDYAGSAKGHHQQHLEFKESAHYQAGIRCFDCHDPHGSSFPSSTRLDPDTNELCLSCHGGAGPGPAPPDATVTGGVVTDVSGHTRHSVDATDNTKPFDGEASKCIGCHMPFTAKSAAFIGTKDWDIRSHSFKFLMPAESVVNAQVAGRPHGCQSSSLECHGASGKAPGYAKWDDDVSAVADFDKVSSLVPQKKPRALGYKTQELFSLAASTTVTLDGSGSFDSYDDGDGSPVRNYSFIWTQLSGPAVTLSDSTIAAPTFTATLTGVYTFELVARSEWNDRRRWVWFNSDPVTVTVTVTQ